jgi:hypothetical protein
VQFFIAQPQGEARTRLAIQMLRAKGAQLFFPSGSGGDNRQESTGDGVVGAELSR